MNFFTRKSQAEDFADLTAGMSNEEVRERELQQLVPERLQKPVCPAANPDTPLTRYVKVYFANSEELAEFEKYVTVRNIGERTSTDTATILEALRTAHANVAETQAAYDGQCD